MEALVNRISEGDCLELLKTIPDKSIRLILADLPYGSTVNPWDQQIDLDSLWDEYMRIIMDDGVISLTAQGALPRR